MLWNREGKIWYSEDIIKILKNTRILLCNLINVIIAMVSDITRAVWMKNVQPINL